MPAYQFTSQGIDAQYGGGGGAGLPAQINGQAVRHPVVISNTELKPTKDQQGGYLEITMTAIDGPCKGQTQVDRLNLHNKSADAVRIANQQLAAYCAVIGVFAFNATEELHNRPFMIETKPRSDNANTFEPAKLYDVNGNEPGKAGSGGQPQGGAGFGQQQPGQGQPGGFGQPQGQQSGGFQPPPADQGQGQPQGGAQPGTQWGQGQGGGQPQGQGQPQAGWNQGGGQPQPGWGQR